MDIHEEIEQLPLRYDKKIALHYLADYGSLIEIICQMPNCLFDQAPFVFVSDQRIEPMSLEIDHIVCQADGGGSRADNIRIAHQLCNRSLNPSKGSNKQREKKRYAARKYSRTVMTCSCGVTMQLIGFSRHVGRTGSRPGHAGVECRKIDSQAGGFVKGDILTSVLIPAGRPGWQPWTWHLYTDDLMMIR